MVKCFLRDEAGLTLVELVIVLAIIAIVGAVLAQSYFSTTDKARLRSDIQSARVILNAMELYNAEQDTVLTDTSMDNILKKLREAGYLNNTATAIQSSGAVWKYDSAAKVVKVDVTACDTKVKSSAYSQLTSQEKEIVTGGTATP